MKKKLLLALSLMVLLVCLFAISVSAEDMTQYIEFKVQLAGEADYISVYQPNTKNNPELLFANDFYTKLDKSETLDKTKIAKIDLSNATANGVNVKYIGILGAGTSTDFVNVTEIKFPNQPGGFTTIGAKFCKGWTSLESIDFGSATTIKNNAFYGCTSLKEVTVPATVTYIETNLFDSCTGLTKATILGEATLLSSAFANCTSLTDVSIENVTSVSSTLFSGCSSLKSVTLPKNAAKIESKAFIGTSITSIVIPASVTEIGEKAFQNLTTLKTITFEENSKLTTIGTYVFEKSGLSGEIELPSSLTSVGQGAFNGCTGITGNIDLPNVTSIGSSAFNGCTGITSVKLGSKLTAIKESVFSGCTSLSKIYIDGQEQEYALFIPEGVTSIEKNAFSKCSAFKYISLPTTLTFIGATAFNGCSSLEFVDFNDNKNNIDTVSSWACSQFSGCSNLKAVSLPDNVTVLQNRIFSSCTNLQAVYLPANLVQMNTNGNGQGPFCYNKNMYFVQEPFEVRGENGMFLGDSFQMPSKPDVYYMPSTLTSAAGNVDSGTWFRDCIGLNTTIVMPKDFVNSTVNQMFRETANANNIKNVVYLGDMNSISWSERNHHINFIFANAKDTDISSVTFSSFYNNLNNDCYFYFCSTGYKYTMAVASADLIADTLQTNEYRHIHDLRKDSTTPADCVTDGSIDTFCFCGAKMTTKVIEALGHDYTLKAEGAAPEVYAWYYVDDNFFGNATEQHKCLDCEALYDLGKEIANTNLFEAGGYSIPEQGTTDCISHTIMINKTNIDLYAQHTNGAKINYGTVAAAGSALGTPIEIDEEGNVTPKLGALIADMTGTDYVKLVIKVSGIPLNTEALVNCNAYIVVGKEIYYVCGSEVLDIAKEQRLGKTA